LKKLYWILGLLVLTFIGDRLGGLILKKAAEKSQFRYSRLYSGAAESEILLVGNSRGLIFYQPYIEEVTGKNTFNTSYNGMPINLARVFVEDYLDKYTTTEKLVLDITMCDRLNDQLIAGFNFYTPYSDGLTDLVRAKQPTMARGAVFSHLFRYNGEIFLRSLKYCIGGDDEDWLNDRVMNDYMIENVVYEKDYKIDFEKDTIDLLDTLITDLVPLVRKAQEKGLEVHLVINPYYPAFADKIVNLGSMKSRVESATGLPVKDYSKAVTDPKGFSDYQHLNKVGSRMYIDLLRKDGVL